MNQIEIEREFYELVDDWTVEEIDTAVLDFARRGWYAFVHYYGKHIILCALETGVVIENVNL